MSKLSDIKNAIVEVFSQEPAVVRGVIVAVSAVAAQVLGHTVFSNETVEAILNAYTAISALVAALFIRPKVTPAVNVVTHANDVKMAVANEDAEATNGPVQDEPENDFPPTEGP